MGSQEDQQDRFLELEISGFRRLHEVKLALRPLGVMIGANGVGKTSILDVLALLASSASGKLSSSLSELGGLPNLLTYDRSNQLEFGVSIGVAGQPPLDYGLQLKPDGIAYRIEYEALSSKTGTRRSFLLSPDRCRSERSVP